MVRGSLQVLGLGRDRRFAGVGGRGGGRGGGGQEGKRVRLLFACVGVIAGDIDGGDPGVLQRERGVGIQLSVDLVLL